MEGGDEVGCHLGGKGVKNILNPRSVNKIRVIRHHTVMNKKIHVQERRSDLSPKEIMNHKTTPNFTGTILDSQYYQGSFRIPYLLRFFIRPKIKD